MNRRTPLRSPLLWGCLLLLGAPAAMAAAPPDVAVPGRARLDAAGEPARLFLRTSLGFSGRLMAPLDASLASGGHQLRIRRDLEATAGIGVHLDIPVLPYLSVGPQVGVRFWGGAGEPNPNNALIEMSVVVRARFRFPNGRTEVYLATPVGLLVSVMEDLRGTSDAGDAFRASFDTGVGVTLSAVAGIHHVVQKRLGLFMEAGMVYHLAFASGRVDFDAPGLGGGATETRPQWLQFGLNLGLTFGL